MQHKSDQGNFCRLQNPLAIFDEKLQEMSKMGSFDEYQCIKCLGEGTFGVVFKAIKKSTSETVVLKLLKEKQGVSF